jgi:hypothetical protein
MDGQFTNCKFVVVVNYFFFEKTWMAGWIYFGKFCWEIIIVWQCLCLSVCVLLSFFLFLLLLQCFNFSSFKLLSLKAKKKKKEKQLQQQQKSKERKREAQQQHTHTHSNRSINYLNTQSFLRKGGVTAPHHNVAFFLIFKCPAVCLTLAIKITHTKLRQPNKNTATKNKIKKSKQ